MILSIHGDSTERDKHEQEMREVQKRLSKVERDVSMLSATVALIQRTVTVKEALEASKGEMA